MEVRARSILRIKGLVAVAFAACLAGCSFYHHRFDVASAPKVPSTPEDPPELHIIQSDDFGTLWDLAPAQQALNSINRQWPNTNVLVMVFIHGWHHNAKQNDDDLENFSLVLNNVATQFAKPNRRKVREKLTGQPDFKVIGIYIGWRGRSLPDRLDYLTATWRKAAAQRVGAGDVSELLQRLQSIYRTANRADRTAMDEQGQPIGNDAERRVPIMGLVTMGHSFGAQVLLQSVARSLEYALIQRAPCMADMLGNDGRSPADQKEIEEACNEAGKIRDQQKRGRNQESRPIESLGDMCILLNPAVEAYQFRRIEALYQQSSYENTQAPQLIVFSADNDWARATFFPIQRAMTLAVRPMFRGTYQGSLWGNALGEMKVQHTHELTKLDPVPKDSLNDFDYTCREENDPSTDDTRACGDDEDPGDKVRKYDFTSTTTFSDITLQPISANSVKNSPVAVVYTKKKIIDGHSRIFEAPFLDFLTKYIAFAEGKRFLWRAKDRQEEKQRQKQELEKP